MSSQIQFYYQFSGNKHKPVILFLHGFMGSGSDWDETIKYLSSRYHCLTVDLPGHGKTEYDGEILFEETADILIESLDQQKIKQCFLAGYSMGGRLALFLTLRYPQYFRKVVLESASPGLRTEKEREERILHEEEIVEKLTSGDFSAFLKEWYSETLFKGLNKHEKFEQLLKARMKNDPKKLTKSLRLLGTGKQPSLWRELKNAQKSILLLVGELDTKFQSIARRMKELNSFIQLEMIENCSHNIHFQQPEQFARHLHQYFSE